MKQRNNDLIKAIYGDRQEITYQHYTSNFINPNFTHISISLYIQETSYMK